jgi:hypothetical protein
MAFVSNSSGFRPFFKAPLASTLLLCLASAAFSQSSGQIQSINLDSTQVTSGLSVNGTVTLNGAGAKSVKVQLSSNSKAIAFPSAVYVPAGQTQIGFTVRAGLVTSPTIATLTAKVKGSTASAKLTVALAELSSFELNADEVLGGSRAIAKVWLTGKAGPGGVRVKTTSSDGTIVSAPGEIVVPEGSNYGQADFLTKSVSALRTVNVGASLAQKSFQQTLGIRPRLASDDWQPVATNANPLVGGGFTPAQSVPGALTQVTSRVSHKLAVPQGVEGVRLVYANYTGNLPNQGEAPGWNSIYVKASVEKVSGVYPVTFGGQTVTEIPPGEIRISDPIYVPFEANEVFYTRTTQSVAVATDKLCGGFTSSPAMAEGVVPGDYAYGGTIPAGVFRDVYSPSAVLGTSSQPFASLALSGDSIMAGADDAGFRVGAGGFGERLATGQLGLGEDSSSTPVAGYVHVAKGGERSFDFLKSKVRFYLTSLSSTVLVNYVTNDIGAFHPENYPEAAIKKNLVNLVRRWTDLGKKVIFTTCLPRANSTDGFLSVGGQTPLMQLALRNRLNAWLRDPQGLVGEVGAAPGQVVVWDTSKVVEVDANGIESTTGGLWKADPYVVQQGLLSGFQSSGQLTDNTQIWTQNSFRGYSVSMRSGNCLNQTRGVRQNEANGRFMLRAPFNSTPTIGDTYIIAGGVYTGDGIHPTSFGHSAIAASFDLTWLAP